MIAGTAVVMTAAAAGVTIAAVGVMTAAVGVMPAGSAAGILNGSAGGPTNSAVTTGGCATVLQDGTSDVVEPASRSGR